MTSERLVTMDDSVAVQERVAKAIGVSKTEINGHWSPGPDHGLRRISIGTDERDLTEKECALIAEHGIFPMVPFWKMRDSSNSEQRAGRAITRGEEARVREAVARACGVQERDVTTLFFGSAGTLIQIGVQGYVVGTESTAKLARAGIVSGADGWCWAAPTRRTRPITRADMCAVVDRITDALEPFEGTPGLTWSSDGTLQYISLGAFGTREQIALDRDELAALERAGIWTGARGGWDMEEMAAGEVPAGMLAVQEGAPPAWLTAAVLAALPASGEVLDIYDIAGLASSAPEAGDRLMHSMVRAALAHLVSTGEIEAGEGEGTWRRWGVPEGWAWARMAADNGDMLEHDGDIVADVGDDGRWAAFPATPVRSAIEQHEITRGRAETPAAARQAALRACHERGVFGPRPEPTLTTSTPQGAGMGEQVAIAKAIAGAAPTRAEQVRAALLSVLSGGPVEGLARLLPALDAAMGEAPGVARTTGAEARQAAREAGVSVDGARWSVPPLPLGFLWHVTRDGDLLAPLLCDSLAEGAVAQVFPGGRAWRVAPSIARAEVIRDGMTESETESRAQALAAARLAGLFARPVAAEVTGDGGPPVLPAVTAQGGEAVAKVASAPLASGHALAAQIERMVGIREGQSDCSLARMIEAFAVGVEERARASVEALPEFKVLTNRQSIDASGTWRVYADDGRTVIGEDVLVPHPTDPASVQAQASADRAAAEARLEAEAAAAARGTLARDYAAERALSESLRMQLEEAETARDDARAALSDLRAALADLAARWAGGAA